MALASHGPHRGGSVTLSRVSSTTLDAPADAPSAEPAEPTLPLKYQLRRRLLGRPRTAREKLWAWLGPALVAVIGGILRFWDLGRPHQLIFDETYYVKEGWSLIQYGIERQQNIFGTQSDNLFTMGSPQVYGSQADFVVHPPFGKWVIGFFEWIFGIDSSFGWRVGVALAGTIAIYLIGRCAWHLFRSPLLATLASILLCFEGAAFVMSRVSILDGLVMFWPLAAFAALLADRDRSRRILADKVAAVRDAGQPVSALGPWLGWRPWRWVAAVCLGLGMATKWSDGFYLAIFGLMTVWWDLGARRAVGARNWIAGTFLKDALPAMVKLVGVSVLTYLICWTGWFRSHNGYDRTWAVANPATQDSGLSPDSSLFAWLPDSLRSLWQYHIEMYNSAKSITSEHPYMSNPWSWILQTRPTSFFYESPGKDAGCTVDQCSKAITSLGNPLIWWFGAIALVICIFYWLFGRDWRAGAIVGGVMAGWLPWFSYQDRTIFTFYSVVFVPYIVLACVFVLGLVLGAPDASVRRVRVGRIAVGSFTVLTVALFVFFWPIWTAQVIPYTHWQARMWLPSWI